MTNSQEMHLSVHPSVVFKLGQDLITDDVQALVELIKNAYDAESTSVEVVIDTKVWTDLRTGVELDPPAPAARGHHNNNGKEGSTTPVRGRIIVRDRGVGMHLETIRDGWLTVSGSGKKRLKEHPELLKGRRTPLGDKGLGRLGAQRLGRIITLTTVPRDRDQRRGDSSPGYAVTFCWEDFEHADSLANVPIQLQEFESGKVPHGTTLEIRGLNSPDEWSPGTTKDLERRLSTMMSPYEDIPGFKVRIVSDEIPVDLRERTTAIRDMASVAYVFKYEAERLEINAQISTLYLQPLSGQDDIAIFDKLIGLDNGFTFLEWLLKKEPAKMREIGIEHGDDVRFGHAKTIIDVSIAPGYERTPTEGESQSEAEVRPIIDPGPFSGEVEQVVLRINPTNVFDSDDEYRDFVRAIRGIRIYRDGFGVPVADDWLNLAAQWSSASSFYTIRPENVIGHIDLTARWNAALVETTNREAFSDTPAFRNFLHLVAEWLSYSERLQSVLRRGYNDYKKSELAYSAEVPVTMTPKLLVTRVKSQMGDLDRNAKDVAAAGIAVSEIWRVAAELTKKRDELESQLLTDPRTVQIYENAITQINAATKEAQVLLARTGQRVESFDRERASLDLLLEQVTSLEQQVRDSWEAVSLGLTAEALSHEVNNVVDRLRGRSTQFVSYLRSAGVTDRRTWNYVDHVRSSTSSLAKQLSRLDPSLRNVRERRETTSMSKFLSSVSEYFDSRWAEKHLRLIVEVVDDFSVNMNTGKLSQVFDNLLLNSEYWLESLIQSGGIVEGIATVTVEAPYVTVSDNGPGVNPSVENSIFEPFVTTKPGTVGRGLGLFVVGRLLDSEKIRIGLDETRNSRGRRTTLRLDFRYAVLAKK